MTALVIAMAATLVTGGLVVANSNSAHAAVGFEVRNLDGSGNNLAHPSWGQLNQPYIRVGPARFADGRSQMASGPNSRFVSNRIFGDEHQNIFSERSISQWGWTWGQFLDHTFGLAAGGTESANIPFNSNDPLEHFTDTLGVVPFTRDAAAPGTGTTNPREAINTIPSFVDGFPVYGGTADRLEWLRSGSVDGNVTNNSASLMLPNGYLPRADARGNASTAPAMARDGRLLSQPNRAMVAGDVRANENFALTATQTLFAREHNRIVGLLPASLSEQDKFDIARRIVGAEEQYITYSQFLPAMGVNLPGYSGYNANVNPTLSTEFATVGYRAHSQIHGEFEFESEQGRWSQAQLNSFAAQGIEVTTDNGNDVLTVPTNVAFFNPDLVTQIQLGPMLEGLSGESQYKNDEMIDNQLRSVLFQVPVPGNPTCAGSDDAAPACFTGVVDLGAIDIERGRDHGVPTYNQLRQAYGLAPRTTFEQVTGEPASGNININDPNILNFTGLFDVTGDSVTPGSVASENTVKRITRQTSVASRLRAIYGSVDNIDAFTGMIAEPHFAGSEFGELQRAIWARQFQALRDGDRFFYQNDPALASILSTYNIDYRHSLAQVIADNTDIPLTDLPPNVFFAHGDVPVTSCRVTYTINNQWSTNGSATPNMFQVNMRISNTGSVPTSDRWTLNWSFPNGQTFTNNWNGTPAQEDQHATVQSVANGQGTIPAGGSIDGIGFQATRGATNAVPNNFTLNTTPCSVG
ncbi:MAG: peroxidase [Micromonosporaceae bacterium]